MLFVCHPQILHKTCFQILLGLFYLPGETEDNVCTIFWSDKQRALEYIMVFLEWSIAVASRAGPELKPIPPPPPDRESSALTIQPRLLLYFLYFTSTPFDFLLILWVKNNAQNLDLCLFIVSRTPHNYKCHA